ncbi:MAG: hypothetical protein AAGC55_21660, partial [Myxococcota bacterium]
GEGDEDETTTIMFDDGSDAQTTVVFDKDDDATAAAVGDDGGDDGGHPTMSLVSISSPTVKVRAEAFGPSAPTVTMNHGVEMMSLDNLAPAPAYPPPYPPPPAAAYPMRGLTARLMLPWAHGHSDHSGRRRAAVIGAGVAAGLLACVLLTLFST